MSMNFDDPMNREAHQKILEMFGDKIEAIDETTALIREMGEIDRKAMTGLANTAGQPVTVELNGVGERKVVAGTEYVVTDQGWRKAQKV